MVSIGKRVSTLRKAAGLNQTELAKKLDVSQAKVSKWESDTHMPTAEDLQRLAALFKVDTKDILGFGTIDPLEGRNVEVVGELQAGAFAEALEWQHEDRYLVKVPLDDDLMSVPLQGYIVRGESMNRLYPDGSIVYIAPLHAVGALHDGDIVMVMRRDKHGLVEGTVKEYVVEDGHKWLWPRSSHPEHQAPIDYAKGRNGDIEEVMITGVVVAALVRARRGR